VTATAAAPLGVPLRGEGSPSAGGVWRMRRMLLGVNTAHAATAATAAAATNKATAANVADARITTLYGRTAAFDSSNM
jgi:hypothetical protein